MDESLAETADPGIAMVSSLYERGYGTTNMDANQEMVDDLMTELKWYKSNFVCLPSEFEAEYLGHEPNSKVVWLDRDLADLMEAEGTSIGHYMRALSHIGSLTVGQASGTLDLNPASIVSKLMIRQNLAGKSESDSLRSEGLTEEQKQNGEVGVFLDFIQRRKFCCMYIISCEGGDVELTSRHPDSGIESVTLPASAGMFLVFRTDIFDYAFRPSGKHIVIQGWVLSEPKSLVLDEIVGTEEQIMEVTGAEGQHMTRGDDIHFTTFSCKIGAGGINSAVTPLYAAQTDVFVKIPAARWDHDAYWAPELVPGKGTARHAGLVSHEDMFQFDNEYFGLTEQAASYLTATNYMEYETTAELMTGSGWAKGTGQGAKIDLYVANFARDMEMPLQFASVHQDKESMRSLTGISSFLLSHHFGFTGKSMLVDTACSGSNVAVNMAYQDMRIRRDGPIWQRMVSDDLHMEAIVIGSIFYCEPTSFVGLSSAHMLGETGRSKTYDMSANGYARGEGIGGLYMRHENSIDAGIGKIADMVGGFINQDGRSASLTAPNGPSQTLVVQGSLKDAKRQANTTAMSEMHGTGTALGDPIETGSLKAALNRERDFPLLHQAGKSMTGHLESGAGITGIMKTIFAVSSGLAFPNCHLCDLNANIEESGYPALWPTEATDVGLEWIHAGISSFGFGGTNVRSNIWGTVKTAGQRKVARVTQHPSLQGMVVAKPDNRTLNKIDLDKLDCLLTTCPRCGGPMCWESSEAYDNFSPGKHYPTQIRSDLGSYDICSNCYTGGYRLGGKAVKFSGSTDKKLYVIGSWSNWKEYEEMQQTLDGTSYIHAVRVASDGEQFRIALDQDPNQELYPMTDEGHPRVKILGPDDGSKGRSWLIGGQDRNIPNGTVYRIQFNMGYDSRSIEWEAVVTPEEKDALRSILGDSLAPQIFENNKEGAFSIVGSFSDWAPKAMTQSKENSELWETSFKVGALGKEEFKFIRNNRFDEAVYPAGSQVTDPSVYIRGPDGKGNGKNWLVRGGTTEEVKVSLLVSEGAITMKTSRMVIGERVWKTKPPYQPRYYVVGTWTDWKFADEDVFELKPLSTRPNVYMTNLVLRSQSEDFQIGVDKDWSRMYHPPTSSSIQRTNKQRVVQGPDGKGHNLNWTLQGRPGARVQIFLDLSSETKGPQVSYDLL